VGVAAQPGLMTYFRFNEPALNTFSASEAAVKQHPPYHVIERIEMEVRRLDQILVDHVPMGQTIDFMSVDVENMELEVLSSNDWHRFRPRFVLAETLRTSILDLNSCEVVKLMNSVGYEPIAKAYNTTFFRDLSS